MNFDNNFRDKETSALAEYFHNMNKEKARLEVQMTELNKHLNSVNFALTEKMTREGQTEEVTIEGVKYKIKDTENFSLDKEIVGNEDWDDEHGHFFKMLHERGDQDLIKTVVSVHAGTRKSYLKKLLDKGECLPDFIKHSVTSMIGFNKKAIERLVGA